MKFRENYCFVNSVALALAALPVGVIGMNFECHNGYVSFNYIETGISPEPIRKESSELTYVVGNILQIDRCSARIKHKTLVELQFMCVVRTRWRVDTGK